MECKLYIVLLCGKTELIHIVINIYIFFIIIWYTVGFELSLSKSLEENSELSSFCSNYQTKHLHHSNLDILFMFLVCKFVCCPLTVVIDGLRYYRLQRNQLPCRQTERGLEAKSHWIQVKLLLPHLCLWDCRQDIAGKGWGAQSNNTAFWQSTASCPIGLFIF